MLFNKIILKNCSDLPSNALIFVLKLFYSEVAITIKNWSLACIPLFIKFCSISIVSRYLFFDFTFGRHSKPEHVCSIFIIA